MVHLSRIYGLKLSGPNIPFVYTSIHEMKLTKWESFLFKFWSDNFFPFLRPN